MSTAKIDFGAMFAVAPTPYAVLDPHLVIADVNQAFLDVTERTRDELIGKDLFSVFPADPAGPSGGGKRRLEDSLRWVATSRRPDTMAPIRYDVAVPGRSGEFEERWWSSTITPVAGPDGTLAWFLMRTVDVTAFVDFCDTGDRPSHENLSGREQALAAELFDHALELQRLNDELRRSYARERQVALAIQDRMLHTPDLARHPEIAVRYEPATESLHVCGDWYDVADLTDGVFSMAVGDVVGHGLEAAAIMGTLRFVLSGAVRNTHSPAQALQSLDQYAGSVEGALGATAVKAVIHPRSRLIAYSSAGHPPPVLAHAGGGHELLDRATDPPLGVRPEVVPRPQATLQYRTGDTLVLYTDGLIERRGEDIDIGLARLTATLAEYRELPPQELADALLDRLRCGASDDVALVVVRL
ncbi:PP2C family protein-serine/threonine phosphatase [Actinoallomurus soli]|uniref:PP2C family protein-serine/threonine phosphatase n=1 Tax=Actinoallomurus soli TaxID=2952535 RepID=UPI002092CE39|nr:SpoIIE family protein phosphatase [Actinoallomurus soli]MCO5968909.1 SpoIIE family protein phosphatase [Actinoallomurus soli]